MMLHVLDLTSHEQTRLAAVLEACEGLYDPIELLGGEQAAAALLYSGLDAEQQAIYDMLRSAGILP